MSAPLAVLADRAQKAAYQAAVACYDRFKVQGKRPLGTDYAEVAADAVLRLLLPKIAAPIPDNARAFVCPDCQAQWQRKPLTPKQHAILKYIENSILQREYAPSYEEIAERFDFQSLATVWEHLDNLEKKGWIARRYNEARSITLVEAPAHA